MCAKQVTKAKPGEVGTTGHSWDGIEELNNPLPRWWLWTFYLTILFALVYSVMYPAWPMITRATPGILGYSTRANVQAEIDRFDAANADMKAKLVAADLATVKDDAALMGFAGNAGAAVFKNNCAQCHGAGAAGVMGIGFPNLKDNDWLWGGDIEAIYTTISHGIRNTTDPDARISEMPKFGADGLLEPAQIGEVVEHVLAISGQEHDATKAAAGATVFADNCAACHGDAGAGIRDVGAPNLTDAIWLYGGSRDEVTNTVTNAHYGVMPAWAGKLSEDQIRAVALYVHGLGGGE